jgi:hypothetical protein
MPAVLSCPVCPENGFSSKKNLVNHMKDKHNRMPSDEELVLINKTCKALLKVKRVIKVALDNCLSNAEREHCAPSSNGSVKQFTCVSCGDDVYKVDLVNHMCALHGVDKKLIKSWATYHDAGVLRYGNTYKRPKDDSYCIFERLFCKAAGNADEGSDNDGEEGDRCFFRRNLN